MAAEMRCSRTSPRTRPCCFNEAAANGRGNIRIRTILFSHRIEASMRPRRMAAEIVPERDIGPPAGPLQ